MTEKQFERMIRDDLRQILNNPKLHVDDIQEWSTSETVVKDNLEDDTEIYVKAESVGVHCAVLKSADKRGKK